MEDTGLDSPEADVLAGLIFGFTNTQYRELAQVPKRRRGEAKEGWRMPIVGRSSDAVTFAA
jgi:hypothetical protein